MIGPPESPKHASDSLFTSPAQNWLSRIFIPDLRSGFGFFRSSLLHSLSQTEAGTWVSLVKRSSDGFRSVSVLPQPCDNDENQNK